MQRALRVAVTLVVTFTVLAACGGDDDAGPTGQPPDRTPASPPTTEPADPFAIPDEIDEAYVERVLNELAALNDEALRIAMREPGVPEESLSRLDAAYTPAMAEASINQLIRWATEGFPDFLPEPGNVRVTVHGVELAGPDCVVARVSYDSSGVTRDGRVNGPFLTPMTRKSVDQDPDNLNPTPWVSGGNLPIDGITEAELACDEL